MDYKVDDLLIYEDDQLVGINKTSGLLSLPDGYDHTSPHVRSVLEPELGRLWIVHRLDRDTSGVMILARNAAAHRALNSQFERRELHKIYHALVVGDPEWVSRTIDLSLQVDGDRRHRSVVSEVNGLSAITEVRVITRFTNTCLVEAIPKTGRRHQIRAHLSAVGHPIIADGLYGGSQQLDDLRLALHAVSLTFQHPATQLPLSVSAPYTEDIVHAFHGC